jgi:hypothetical protein
MSSAGSETCQSNAEQSVSESHQQHRNGPIQAPEYRQTQDEEGSPCRVVALSSWALNPKGVRD